MTVRKASEDDIGKVAAICMKFYGTHNIFSLPAEEVPQYMGRRAETDELLVYDDSGEIKAAVFLVSKTPGREAGHRLWKLRHFAFSDEKAAEGLLDYAEKKIKEKSESCKIIVFIAEGEPGMEIFKERGYSQEGILESHYRKGEKCFVMGKAFS